MALFSKSLVETLCESGPKSLFWVARPQLFTRWIALSTGWITIQRISVREANCAIQWIVIYPVDNVIHLLYNWGQMCTRILSARHDRPVKSHCLICQSGWRDIRDTSSYSLGSKTRIFGTVRTPLDEAILSAVLSGKWNLISHHSRCLFIVSQHEFYDVLLYILRWFLIVQVSRVTYHRL